MQLKEAIERRASVRQFTKGEVRDEDLREMARLAHLAPSVNNSQPWRFIAIKNHGLLTTMAAAVHEKIREVLPDSDDESAKRAKQQVDWFSTFFGDAPAAIAVLSRPYEAVVDCVLPGTNLSHEQMNVMRGCPDIESIGAAVEHILLAAEDMGYGACWLSGPLIAREKLDELLEVNAPWRLAALVAVGRTAAEHRQKEKLPLEEVFEFRL